MDPDLDPGGPKHMDPVDPDQDSDPEHWFWMYSDSEEEKVSCRLDVLHGGRG